MSDLKEILKEAPIVEIAIGLNMIADIIDSVKTRTGVEITPDNIGQYNADRKLVREQLNAELGVTGE